MLIVGSMRGNGVLKRAGLLLAGAAALPALLPSGAAAQSSGGQSIPDIRFSLPPKPTPTPAPPPSGPVVAPFSRPTPTPAPAPAPSATPAPVAPPPVSSTTPRAAPSATPQRTQPQASGQPGVVSPQPGATATPQATPTGPATATPEAPPIAIATSAPRPVSSGGWSTELLVALGVAGLGLAAAGYFLFGRRRRGEAELELTNVAPPKAAPKPAPRPAPAPPPPPPAPRDHLTVPMRRIAEPPAPPPPPPPPRDHLTVPARRVFAAEAPGGEPKLEIVFIPRRAGTDQANAAVDYRIIVRNAGGATARDIAFGIYMLSASARQAAELQMIFGTPVDRPVVAPFELPPGGEVELSGTAAISRDNLNVMTIEGKPWFVPVLAMKAEYRWGDNGGVPGLVTAAHMIGINRGDGVKMAPFRLDNAPQMHPRVAERKVA